MGDIHTGAIFIRGARQLLTLRGPRFPRYGADLNELSIIYDGALLIRDGAVEEVGPTRRVENLAAARGAVEISAAGRVVMPGFVDSHTHLAFPMAPDGDSLEAAAAAVRTVSSKRLAGRSRVHLESMARHGTTTIEAKTGCGSDERVETKLLRVLKSFARGPVDVIPTFLFRLAEPGEGGDAAVHGAANRVISEFLPKLRRRRLIEFADFRWDPAPHWQPVFARYLHASEQLELRRKMHAERFDAAALEPLGGTYPLVSLDHLEEATAEDAAAIRRCGAVATLSPTASLHGGKNYAPARALIDAGVPVALASNFDPLHTPTLNMQTVVALACMHMRMTAAEAINAAIINGAYAAGCADRVGSLEHGKSADLVILNVSDYRELANHFGMNLVHLTMKRGEFIYQEGDVAPVPAEDLRLAW